MPSNLIGALDSGMALLLVVLVPTACMVWFLTAAMENTSLAVRQRLTDVYRQRVLAARDALGEHWRGQLAALDDYGKPLNRDELARRLGVTGDDSLEILRRRLRWQP